MMRLYPDHMPKRTLHEQGRARVRQTRVGSCKPAEAGPLLHVTADMVTRMQCITYKIV